MEDRIFGKIVYTNGVADTYVLKIFPSKLRIVVLVNSQIIKEVHCPNEKEFFEIVNKLKKEYNIYKEY